MSQQVPPELGIKSFTCPHCGAISHQTWFRVFAHSYQKKGEAPFMPVGIPIGASRELGALFLKIMSKKIFQEHHKYASNSGTELRNLHVSKCYSCGEWAVWVTDNLIFPQTNFEIAPNPEMPDDIKVDFNEAASIVGESPRGAAALLRLCIQKIVVKLGEDGKNLNRDIAALVKKGLNTKIQQALDLVRVIGNNAVHPGVIDIHDDKAAAIKLFGLVNVIVEAMIAAPKHIEEMCATVLPDEQRKQIEKRDGPKGEK
jgi:hypothetical protein